MYSDTGLGHKRTAEAIMDCCREYLRSGGSARDVVAVELFTTLFPWPVRRFWPALYAWLTRHAVWAYNLLFVLTNNRYACNAINSLSYVLTRRRLKRLIESIEPCSVGVTTLLASELLCRVRRDLRLTYRVVTVITDLGTPHRLWAAKDSELCVTMSESVCAQLVKRGAFSRIHSLVNPIVPLAFLADRCDKEEARTRLNLAQKPTVLIAGGGLGVGGILRVVRTLQSERPHIQLLAVCAGNDRLRARIARLAQGDIHVYGLVDNMRLLVDACDVMVAKAGPLTILEAGALGKPILITGEIGIQEHGNAAHAVTRGYGELAKSTRSLVEHIDSMVNATDDRRFKPVWSDGAYRTARALLLRQPHLF